MRSLSPRFRFPIVLLLVGGCLALSFAPATAGLAPSRATGETEVQSVRDADLIAVRRALEHRVVVQKLRDYGMTPEEAQARVARLSDEELHQLATASRGLPSGGDGVGALIGVLIVVLLVIVIIKLLNKEIVIR
jgi:hypothetical protein